MSISIVWIIKLKGFYTTTKNEENQRKKANLLTKCCDWKKSAINVLGKCVWRNIAGENCIKFDRCKCRYANWFLVCSLWLFLNECFLLTSFHLLQYIEINMQYLTCIITYLYYSFDKLLRKYKSKRTTNQKL